MRLPTLSTTAALLPLLAATAAAQDTCADAILLGDGTTQFDLGGLSLDPSQSLPVCSSILNSGRDIWFSYVPASDAFSIVGFEGQTHAALVEVYEGSCGSLARINASACGQIYTTGAWLNAGERYFIRVSDHIAASGTLTVTGTVVSDRRIYVDASAAPGGNGSSWSSAFRYLSDALDLAERSVPYVSSDDPVIDIWVARGVYRTDESEEHPGGTDDRTASFVLRDNVRIFGGFRGDESALSERTLFDPAATSFLNGSIGPSPGMEDNALHVVRAETTSDAGHVALLDGFTITSGNANVASSSDDDAHGGGVLAATGKCVIANCTLQFNESHWGGGGAAVRGGADATFANCRFLYNRSGGGGGLMIRDATGRANQCLFLENRGSVLGGALMAGPNAGTIDVDLATFVGNLSPSGAGMVVGDATNVILEMAMFHRNGGFSGAPGDGSTARVNPGGLLFYDYVYAPDFDTTISVAGGGSANGNNLFDLADERPNLDLLFESEAELNFRMGGNTWFAETALASRRPVDDGDIDQDGDRDELVPLDLLLGERVVDGRVAASAFEPQADATNFCTPEGNANYPGGARLLVYGSTKVADDNLILRTVGTPGQAGLFFYGLGQIAPVGIGEGNFCIGSPVRLPVVHPTGDALEYHLDLTSPFLQAPVVAGQRLYFQCWFRDVAMGAPSSNFSSGMFVDFE